MIRCWRIELRKLRAAKINEIKDQVEKKVEEHRKMLERDMGERLEKERVKMEEEIREEASTAFKEQREVGDVYF